MRKTGITELPLHMGDAPPWLFRRMVKLSRSISEVLINEYGHAEFLRRLANPYWFQALSCVLGFDFHSSGTTTVACGALKTALHLEDLGLAVCGGKGKASMHTPKEIMEVGEALGLSTDKITSLEYSSRMSAKVDNTAIQAGYPLYHHAFFITEDGKWAVIQQGMSVKDKTARRYHWLSERVEKFVVEPHNAIVGDVKREIALDMTSRESEGCRKASVDIIKEEPRKVAKMLKSIRPVYQRSLQEWIPQTSEILEKEYVADFLSMPLSFNWKALSKAYEFQPHDYEDLLKIRGVGPSTVRGLALISELIYGEKPSWRDPVEYSFCVGGKDGVPFPVDRGVYDEIIDILGNAVKQAKVGEKERINAIKRLRDFTRE